MKLLKNDINSINKIIDIINISNSNYNSTLSKAKYLIGNENEEQIKYERILSIKSVSADLIPGVVIVNTRYKVDHNSIISHNACISIPNEVFDITAEPDLRDYFDKEFKNNTKLEIQKYIEYTKKTLDGLNKLLEQMEGGKYGL